MLGKFEIACEYIDRFPASCAHDRDGIVAGFQEILSGTDTHRMPTEVLDVFRIEPGLPRCSLDEALDGSVAERALDGDALVDWAEERPDVGPPPVEPVRDQAAGAGAAGGGGGGWGGGAAGRGAPASRASPRSGGRCASR